MAQTDVSMIVTAGRPETAPLVMGIVNVTPDSFSDGGRSLDPKAAVVQARSMRDDGADLLDIGGESTRPGAAPVSADEELRRVIPVIERLAGVTPMAIDTRKADVARAAVAAGVSMINDVSASLAPVAAELDVPYVVMHMQGEPGSMQVAPRYDSVVDEVLSFLVAEAEAALDLGVPEVWIDPGVGFGKTMEHNLALLNGLHRFVATGVPVLVGASRKSFIGKLLAKSDGLEDPVPTEDRLEGSVAVATWAMLAGAHAVRVHDTKPTVQAKRILGTR